MAGPPDLGPAERALGLHLLAVDATDWPSARVLQLLSPDQTDTPAARLRLASRRLRLDLRHRFAPEGQWVAATATTPPRLTGCPLHLSLSNEAALAVAAAHTLPVGIDLVDPGVASTTFSPDQLQLLFGTPAPPCGVAPAWALREAYLKCWGVGDLPERPVVIERDQADQTPDPAIGPAWLVAGSRGHVWPLDSGLLVAVVTDPRAA